MIVLDEESLNQAYKGILSTSRRSGEIIQCILESGILTVDKDDLRSIFKTYKDPSISGSVRAITVAMRDILMMFDNDHRLFVFDVVQGLKKFIDPAKEE